MTKNVERCLPCAETMKEWYDLTKTAGGVSNKITCAKCARRRFGATYALTKKKNGGT